MLRAGLQNKSLSQKSSQRKRMVRPTISVIIAVKNGANYLGEAIGSAQAQTWPKTEIIVVDGGSTDGSQEIAASSSNVRLLSQRGIGFAGAWNEAIASSVGEYIAFLDSDDLWDPRKLSLQISALERSPGSDYILARTQFIHRRDACIPPSLKRVDLTVSHAAPFPSALLARKNMFTHVGSFNEDLHISGDVEWFRRARDLGISGLTMSEVLVYRRIHESNLSYFPEDRSCFNRELLSILKASLDRRRSSNF
jgi:glycosyltransferase involved in cell wall biosynthesis